MTVVEILYIKGSNFDLSPWHVSTCVFAIMLPVQYVHIPQHAPCTCTVFISYNIIFLLLIYACMHVHVVIIRREHSVVYSAVLYIYIHTYIQKQGAILG